eukprot:4653690-Amphidinium_carterae.1
MASSASCPWNVSCGTPASCSSDTTGGNRVPCFNISSVLNGTQGASDLKMATMSLTQGLSRGIDHALHNLAVVLALPSYAYLAA